MIGTRLGYTLLLWLLLPGAMLHLARKSRRQPAYLRHVKERFGFYNIAPEKPVIWLHAVSVGETRAAEPLIKSLQEAYPQHQILLTHMTPTGRETGEMLFANGILRCYLPYDFPFAVKRFLRHFKPVLGLLMETEIWFNLIHACKKSGVPLLLVNARMSERSFRKYSRFPSLTRESLKELDAIAAQTETDATRLKQLGANTVLTTGSLKFDIVPPPAAVALGMELRERFGRERRVFLAASTRDGEEALLLDALPELEIPDVLSVIVPRHPQRFDEVAALLERRGIRYQRRSENRPVAPETQVVLGDSMGEMFAYYTACDIAFIGGSLLPYGGQNLIEACAAGKPVLVGPHTFNFAQAAELAVETGAATRVSSAAELMRQLNRLLRDRQKLAAMGQAGLAFSDRHRGATGQILELVAATLPRA